MDSWIRAAGWLVCMAIAPWPSVSADGGRPAPVVGIKPDHIILLDIDKAGDRLVAVGERGFVLYSDDEGATWTARPTPVTRTLTGVAFKDRDVPTYTSVAPDTSRAAIADVLPASRISVRSVIWFGGLKS